MSIDKNKIEEIAKFARINLSEEEKEKYAKQFSSILNYFEQLKEVKTEGVQEFNGNATKDIMREDFIEECDKEMVEDILSEFPERKERFVKVKKVL